MVNNDLAESLLCVALLDDPEQYPKVKYVLRSWFGNAEYRDMWVAATWALDRNPKLSGDGLVEQTRHLLLEHGKDGAATRMTTLLITYPGMGSQAEVYARVLAEAMGEELLTAQVTRSGLIVKDARLTLAEKKALLREAWTATFDKVEGEESLLVPDLMPAPAFVDLTDEPHDWVIPGLLERQQRFMLIAPEKAGKSVFTRQVCLALAVGQHPLIPSQQIPPMRSLLVDLENPAPVIRRDLRRQMTVLGDMWSNENRHAWILHRPAGIHLGDANDLRMLWSVIGETEPDLLVISPIYKAYDGLDRSWEEQAFGVQKPLDRIRERFNCAIWMEHHAPWGSDKADRWIRPIGSSRWARWLDYQAMLVPEQPNPPFPRLRWTSVRRDERMLSPDRLVRGGRDNLPWLAEWDGEEGAEVAYDVSTNLNQ